MKIIRLKSENGTPVLPSARQYQDPTKQSSKWIAAERKMRGKIGRVNKELRRIVREIPKRTSNARTYYYQVDPSMLETIIQKMNDVLTREYLGTSTYNRSFWMDSFVRSAYMSGANDAVDSALNVTSQVAGEYLTEMLIEGTESSQFEAARFNRAALVGSRVFELMKGLTDQTRADLAATLSDGIERGLGVVELSDNLMKRTGVSGSRATRIIRTEVNQAYRQATRRETEVMNDDIYSGSDFELRMLWFSALSKSTRRWHARRHGRTYTPAEVDDFYARGANAINCYCSQTQVLVNTKTGEVFQKDLQAQMTEQKIMYFGEDPDDRPSTPDA